MSSVCARPVGVGYLVGEAQLAGLQWRAASRETWGSRMRHRQPSPS
ncbi:Os03g0323600 [Oryza sativa Japonica Group]|uniref:Os03g0323600 protein n=1 Tax=Oryza sativa subsp. japonica TaxID=39947 RepID=A0A0P0VWS9_ORYSJ|nr:Os03g0323600 [Oryza sativa Japonica Group]